MRGAAGQPHCPSQAHAVSEGEASPNPGHTVQIHPATWLASDKGFPRFNSLCRVDQLLITGWLVACWWRGLDTCSERPSVRAQSTRSSPSPPPGCLPHALGSADMPRQPPSQLAVSRGAGSCEGLASRCGHFTSWQTDKNVRTTMS